MKLYEIKGIKSFEKMTGEELMAELETSGVFKKKLGAGVFGYAFQLSNDEVLKVWHNDPAYEKYIQYCIENHNSPYLLKVHGKVRKFKIKNSNHGQASNMKFVRVEKLEHITSMKQFGHEGSSITDVDMFLDSLQEYIHDNHKTVRNITDIKAFISDLGLKVENSSPKFEKFLNEVPKILHDFYIKLHLALDLHAKNFGMRGDQVVFLDPVYDEDNARNIDNVLKRKKT